MQPGNQMQAMPAQTQYNYSVHTPTYRQPGDLLIAILLYVASGFYLIQQIILLYWGNFSDEIVVFQTLGQFFWPMIGVALGFLIQTRGRYLPPTD